MNPNNDQPDSEVQTSASVSRPQTVYSQTQETPVSSNVQPNLPVQPPATPPGFPNNPIKGSPLNYLKKVPLKIVLGIFTAFVILIGGYLVAQKTIFAPKVPQQITLTYWGLWEDADTLNQLIQEYQTQNPLVKINYVKQSSEEYRERLANSLAKGDGPDIFRFHNTWVPMFSSQLAVLPSDVMDASTFQNTFYPITAKDLQNGSSLVGMPLQFDGLGLYINEDLFTTNGKNPPTTWDDLRKTAQDLTIKDKDGRIQQSGVALGRIENVDSWEDILSLMMLQNGVDMKNPIGKRAEDALAFFTLFSLADHVWDETMPPSTQAFASGKLAMYFGPSWEAFSIKQQNPNLNFRVVPVPQLPKNSTSDPDITWASYWVEGVWSKSKNSQEAWKFLKFLSEKNSLQRLYSQSPQQRLFGPIYPRKDMADVVINDPFVGAYVKQAPSSQSWYLASGTNDGPSGINSKFSALYKTAIGEMLTNRKEPKDVLPTVAQGVAQILSSYRQ